MASEPQSPQTGKPDAKASLSFPAYFTALAGNYAKQTGNSTRNLFAQAFEDIQALYPISKSSVVHDNAAGPGTATSVLVDRLPSVELPTILVTDNVPAMVSAAKDSFASFSAVSVKEIDALKLDIPDNHVTHSILNFSIFTMQDPLKCLQETHRTLKPGGLAVLVTWHRFALANMIHAAQAKLRPDLPPMKLPHPEFLEKGVLEKLAVDAGFPKEQMQVSSKTLVVVEAPDVEGLKGFLLGDFTKPAKRGWSEEEDERWPEVAQKALEEEISKEGGIRFQAWVVLAKKAE